MKLKIRLNSALVIGWFGRRAGDEEERRLAELREKAIRDEVTNREGALEEKTKQIAKKMKSKGIDITEIIEMTDLMISGCNFSRKIYEN